MRAFFLFFLFLLAALLLSTLLNYPLYLLVQESLEKPPHKLISRGAILFAVIGIWFFLRWMGLANRQAIGYAETRRVLLDSLLRGWLLGVLILTGLAVMLVGLGIRAPKPFSPDSIELFFRTVLAGLAGGIAVALIEETFFRGALFSAIRKNGSVLQAMLLPSLLYAALHFVRPVPLADASELSWFSGWQMLAGSLDRFREPGIIDSFIALTAVGMFLAIVRERTGHIGYCIGLHAGWILIIKMTLRFTEDVPNAEYSFLVGGYDGITGRLSTAWIGLLALVVWFRRRPYNG